MNATRESDDCVVPEKEANKALARAEAAESSEERQSAKRDPQGQSTDRAQDRKLWHMRLSGYEKLSDGTERSD